MTTTLQTSVFAVNTPKTVFYQGRLTNDTGVPLDGTFSMDFALCETSDCSSGSDPLWTESHSGVTVDRGVYSVYLGSNTAGGVPEFIFDRKLWLEVTIDGNVFTPRTAFSAMPYAFNAYQLEGIRTGNSSGSIPINNGTINQNLNADMIDGRNLSDLDGRYVDQAGDTMGGTLNMTANDILLNGGWLSGDGDNSLTIDDAGRIGIQTSNPTSAVEIVGNDNDGSTATLELVDPEGDRMILDGDEIDGALGGGAGNESALFLQNNTANNVYMATGGGSVGVGIQSPDSRMHILGPSTGTAFESVLTLEETGDRDRMILDGDEINAGVGGSGGDESALFLQTASPNDVYMVTGGGSVGINTTSPSARLQVVGTDVGSGGNATLKLKESGEGDKMLMDGDEINAAIGGGAGNESALYIQNTNSNDIYMADGGGNVGVGKPSARTQLDVRGTGRFVQPSDGEGRTVVHRAADGDSFAWNVNQAGAHNLNLLFNNSTIGWFDDADGSWNKVSDRRLKENIKPVSDVLPKIMKLEPKSFSFKRSEKSKKSFGFVAQEIESVFPSLVTENNGYKYLSYQDLSPLAIRAIQQQQKMINRMKKQIQSLQNQVSALQKQ